MKKLGRIPAGFPCLPYTAGLLHTAGPWTAEWPDGQDSSWVVDAGGNRIAALVTRDGGHLCARGDARVSDLLLLAAAPLMLEVLLRLQADFLRSGLQHPELDHAVSMAVDLER